MSSNRAASLEDYANYLEKTNQPLFRSANEGVLWVPGAAGELIRFPIEDTSEIDREESGRIFRTTRARVLTHLRTVTDKNPANCILYLCRGDDFGMERITRNARKVVRRGLRHFEIRKCSWKELETEGYQSFLDTDLRHGYQTKSKEQFQEYVQQFSSGGGDQIYEIWGAWDSSNLAGWVVLSKIENRVTFIKVCSRTDYLSKAPSNVLHFLPCETYLREGYHYVSTGFSSVQPGAEKGLHGFKLRVGFDAIPVHRSYIVRPILRPIVANKLAAKIWSKSAEFFPRLRVLRKVAGMSRVLSGSLSDPLAWTREAES